jgi:hypothetical protein
MDLTTDFARIAASSSPLELYNNVLKDPKTTWQSLSVLLDYAEESGHVDYLLVRIVSRMEQGLNLLRKKINRLFVELLDKESIIPSGGHLFGYVVKNDIAYNNWFTSVKAYESYLAKTVEFLPLEQSKGKPPTTFFGISHLPLIRHLLKEWPNWLHSMERSLLSCLSDTPEAKVVAGKIQKLFQRLQHSLDGVVKNFHYDPII